jgi:hypothetical protein
MLRKGRGSYATWFQPHKLCLDSVRKIKNLRDGSLNASQVGRIFGVPASTIRSIYAGKCWKQVIEKPTTPSRGADV